MVARKHRAVIGPTPGVYRHEPADLFVVARQLHYLAIEITDLLLYGHSGLKQRFDRGSKLGTILNQLVGTQWVLRPFTRQTVQG